MTLSQFTACLGACLVLAAPGLAQTASGNEPFWNVAVNGDTMTVSRLGMEDTTLAVTERTEADGVATITATNPDEALRAILTLTDEVCRDTMSGMPHPASATLEMGDTVNSGCAGDPMDLLTQGGWQVEDIGGEGIVDMSRVTIGFDPEGRMFGNASCNRFNTGFELTGEGLTIDAAIATTMMACPEAVMEQERRFLTALSQTDRFDIDDTGALVLIGADRPLLLARQITDGSEP